MISPCLGGGARGEAGCAWCVISPCRGGGARGEAVATRSRIGAAALEFGSGTTGDGGGAGGDALVYELSPDDVRVLASRTKAVRLRSGPHGHAGEEVEGVTFAGVVPQREDSKDPAA